MSIIHILRNNCLRGRRVWRYQGGIQNSYIEEQTTQWPKEKVQKDKQLSTKHAVKNKTDTIWWYQRGNQNPYIEEQTTQWPKEKLQNDKQLSTKYTHKTKDRVAQVH